VNREIARQRDRRILELLIEKPRTIPEIAADLGIRANKFYIYRARLQGKIYIKGWCHLRFGCPSSPIYAAGNEEDAPRPAPVHINTMKRSWRARKKIASSNMESKRTEEPKKVAPVRAPMATPAPPPVRRDPWVAAMYGAAA